jgi:NAD(P)H-dependent flavin oxidoreductase YrpB (nitropropane dioxygenase family)
VDGSRRLSQAISEGDGISVIASVGDADAARAAEEDGAEALAVRTHIAGLRDTASLPVLWLGADLPPEADACVLRVGDDLEDRYRRITDGGLECVVDVTNEEELELALERLEPEIFLISPRAADEDDDPLDRVLDLLPDVPAGKLAIAEVPSADRDVVSALERAGFDAVLVGHADVGGLVGAEPPAV